MHDESTLSPTQDKPENTIRENRMGTMPVGKLLLTISAPMMLSMLAQALYNIVDSAFVAQLNEDALTAVTMAFPLQNLMIAISVGLGVGVNAFLSRSLGAKNQTDVNAAATHGLVLTWGISGIFALVCLLIAGPYMRSQTGNPAVLGYGIGYILWVCGVPFGAFNQVILERLLQSTGKTFYSMISQIVGALANTLLDWLLIFGIGFFPRLEVVGAALATVLGQSVAALLALYFNLRHNHEIHISFKGFRLRKEIFKQILVVGVPSMIMQSLSSLMTYGMNLILVKFSETAVAFFGAYFKLQSFVFMPVFGLNNGMVPIVAYNYGARKPARITQTLKYAIAIALGLMALGALLFELFPAPLLQIFNASDAMIAIGVPGMRIIAAHFCIAAFCIIIISSFQALGTGAPSLIISFVRQIVVLLPVAYLLSLSGNINAVWWAFPVAEAVALALSLLLFRRVHRTHIAPLQED
ncbi:MAG: MATE family efflux transporter [Oscillospiraceae bacterium]|jgi:putative MATE family efflux protein|nr:MATE family efflux transporter [Oscillospiraceae bacterium]